MPNLPPEPFSFSSPTLDLHWQSTMDRLSQLVALDSVEMDGFDDAIAQRMPPTWRNLLTLGSDLGDLEEAGGSSFRVAEPFNSPASLIRGEVDLLWNWYLKQELRWDDVAGQTSAIVNSLHVRKSTGTIGDWLPACVSHLVPARRSSI